ncbi:protein SHQ1 homolog [Teleopsis dalmanni]|uniref:protein SHQ1 homolog n=1 Tax=Teleopsis dalmanni TaxID=139649 RepID=UPI0018CD0EFD|nr:protein SHQ1 homolog [Teleopsis dalmanni]
MASETFCLLEYKDTDNCCEVKLVLPQSCESSKYKKIDNVCNLDMYGHKQYILIHVDTQLFKVVAPRLFNLENLTNIVIYFNTSEQKLTFTLPCLIETIVKIRGVQIHKVFEDDFNLLKFKCLTNLIKIQFDNCTQLKSPESNFYYGFASMYNNNLKTSESDLTAVSYVHTPSLVSPIKRTIDREVQEMSDFCPDQYKANAFELYVPEGHPDPKLHKTDFNKTPLSKEETIAICDIYETPLPLITNSTEVDCGLISILLAICYDVRITADDPTCDSARTRSILAPVLCYFEPFYSMKDVVVSFLRRTLIYTYYRNYELSRMCLNDAVDAITKKPSWILAQLIVTHNLFLEDIDSRDIYNLYYMRHYINYLNDKIKTNNSDYFYVLSRNLKNVVVGLSMKMLGLDLIDLELQIVNELMKDFEFGSRNNSEERNQVEEQHLSLSHNSITDDEIEDNDDDDEDDDDDDDDDEEDDEDNTFTDDDTDIEHEVAEEEIEDEAEGEADTEDDADGEGDVDGEDEEDTEEAEEAEDEDDENVDSIVDVEDDDDDLGIEEEEESDEEYLDLTDYVSSTDDDNNNPDSAETHIRNYQVKGLTEAKQKKMDGNQKNSDSSNNK